MNKDKIIEKQKELIDKLSAEIDLYTYKGYYSLNFGQFESELLDLEKEGPEENKVKYLINDVCKWEASSGIESLEKTL